MQIDELQTQAGKAVGLLKALANENRLLILCHLQAGELSVGEINERLGLSQSALSQHLAMLKACGMVEDRRSGQTVTYRIADPRVEKLIASLRDLYCEPPDPIAQTVLEQAPQATASPAQIPGPHGGPNPY